MPTYLCDREKELRYVLANLDKLVVKATNESGGYGMLMGHQATREQREQFALKLDRQAGIGYTRCSIGCRRKVIQTAERMHQRSRARAAQVAVALHQQRARALTCCGQSRRHACAATANDEHVQIHGCIIHREAQNASVHAWALLSFGGGGRPWSRGNAGIDSLGGAY